MNWRPSEDHLSHLPTLAFFLLLNGKDAKETFTTIFCFYPYWKNITNQPTISIQANRGERGWLKHKIKNQRGEQTEPNHSVGHFKICWWHTLPSCTVMVMEEWRSCYWTQPERIHQFASAASGPAFLGPFLISILLPSIASFFYSPMIGKDLSITKQMDSFSGLFLLILLVAFTTHYTFLPQTPLP